MILIDGKKVAAEIREELKKEVSDLKSKTNKVPGLTVVLIGDMAPSQIYVRMKEKAANEVGYRVEGVEKSFKNLENFSHNNAVIIAGGSQGETRSTMTRIANSQHEQIKLKPGDTAIFSSSKIPGNELAIERVHNALGRMCQEQPYLLPSTVKYMRRL